MILGLHRQPNSRGRLLYQSLLSILLVVGAAFAAQAQQVEVEFESVTVDPGEQSYFRILLNCDIAVSGIRVPLLLPSTDLVIDSVSFRYTVAQEFIHDSRFNNNNRRDFVNIIPPLSNVPTIEPPGGEICRVFFELSEFAPGGPIAIDTFIDTRYIGELRVEQKLDASDEFGNTIYPDIRLGEIIVNREVDVDTTGSDDDSPPSVLPSSFTLRQNYPNPFNPTTRITFSVPYTSEVSLTVYDGVGREIEVLTRGTYSMGTHFVEWDASAHPSGIYFYALTTPEGTISRKMVVIK